MKIILNKCYGGFGLSEVAIEWLKENKRWELDKDFIISKWSSDKYYPTKDREELRLDLDVIECVETLGKKANGQHADLSVVEIPDNADWEIDEYDGIESVREKSEVWG